MSEQQRRVVFVPREPISFETRFGEGGVIVGPGDGEVVITMTPAAADSLARIIAVGSALTGLATDVDGCGDQETWLGVVLNLITAAALCQPLPTPVHATRDLDDIVRRSYEVPTW